MTIVTKSRGCLFGEIVDAGTQANALGDIVQARWNDLPRHFNNVTLNAFVVMPNHLHGIIVIGDTIVGAKHSRQYANASPLHTTAPSTPPRGTQLASLGAIMQNFKSVSTRKVNQRRDTQSANTSKAIPRVGQWTTRIPPRISGRVR